MRRSPRYNANPSPQVRGPCSARSAIAQHSSTHSWFSVTENVFVRVCRFQLASLSAYMLGGWEPSSLTSTELIPASQDHFTVVRVVPGGV